jgi:CheY-like chemotaxis protein
MVTWPGLVPAVGAGVLALQSLRQVWVMQGSGSRSTRGIDARPVTTLAVAGQMGLVQLPATRPSKLCTFPHCRPAERVMSDQTKQFGDVAQKLARNPLGIIALFIVLVYGFASMVIIFGSGLTVEEKLPLIYFLVTFPAAVLILFGWLVVKHPTKLFAPGDFKDEENYFRTIAATELTVASLKGGVNVSEVEVGAIVASVQEATPLGQGKLGPYWRSHILWVDDDPDNNTNERKALEAMGLSFTLALSTQEALQKVSKQRFAAIISDMARREGQQEGYVLLDKLRQTGNKTPYFIYSTSRDPKHIRATIDRGGQGHTNSPQELFHLVMKAVVNR